MPASWNGDEASKGVLGEGSILPPLGVVPQLTGKSRPSLDELKMDGLEGRRKANAVFVVLGELLFLRQWV